MFVFVQSQTATRNAKTEIEILQRVNHVSLTPQKKTRRNVLHMMSPLFLTLLPSSIIFSFPFFLSPSFPSSPTCVLSSCTTFRPLLQPCLIKTEDFYQTDDCYYIVLEL